MNTLQIMLITSMQVLASIRWVDEADENGPIDMDIFFDRVVIIAAKIKELKPSMPPHLAQKSYIGKENIAPGVFVTERHVLTSYNPFRYILQDKKNLNNLYVTVLQTRKIEKPELHVYETINATFKCAKQIMSISKETTKNQWHGIDKTHSPVHDLMVLRIEETLPFLNGDEVYSFDNYVIGGSSLPAGPILTKYATEGDHLGQDVKFASLGFRSKRHINKSSKLSSRAYEVDEYVLEDCDKWMPRYWGHFICIRNVDNYKGVGSGAPLVYNSTLYGIGSFTLSKGNESILVFTDVRPYTHLFGFGCPSDVRRSDPHAYTSNGRQNRQH